MTHPPFTRCKTCKRSLDWSEGRGWEHPALALRLDPSIRHHHPEPEFVSESNPTTVAVCDFCSATDRINWRYPCKDFGDEAHGWGSAGGWAACDNCHSYIEADMWTTIERRARRGREVVWPLIGASIRGMWAEFRRNRTGPAHFTGRETR